MGVETTAARYNKRGDSTDWKSLGSRALTTHMPLAFEWLLEMSLQEQAWSDVHDGKHCSGGSRSPEL